MKALKRMGFLAMSALFAQASAVAALNTGEEVQLCAKKSDERRVQQFYAELPGAPTPIPGRRLKMPEVQVVTALNEGNAVHVLATPDLVKRVWSTIDEWGEDTLVHLVFTTGGPHVFDFPSLVPVRQKDEMDGWLDIYADRGDGVHGHLWLDRIRSIHGVDIPGRDGERTRSISFYAADGNLEIGVYASIATREFEQAAVEGFERTRALLESLPRACD